MVDKKVYPLPAGYELWDGSVLPEDGSLEVYEDGRQIVRRAKGIMFRTYAPREVQVQSAKAGGSRDERINLLLDELGLESEADRSLAEILVKGGSGAISAAEKLFGRAKRAEIESGPEIEYPFQDDKDVLLVDGSWYWRIDTDTNNHALRAMRRRAKDQKHTSGERDQPRDPGEDNDSNAMRIPAGGAEQQDSNDY